MTSKEQIAYELMTSAQSSIFISYRRSDSVDVTGRIYDRLTARYDKSSIFKDVDSISYGVDFRKRIYSCICQCNVLIAIVGPKWLEAKERDGTRRLDNPQDWVRIEIEAALKRDIMLIPLLVNSAELPKATSLPTSLQALAYRNAAQAPPRSRLSPRSRLGLFSS